MSTEFIFFTKFKYQVESGRAAQCDFRGGGLDFKRKKHVAKYGNMGTKQ